MSVREKAKARERERKRESSHTKYYIKFKLFYIFVTPLCDIIRAHSHPHPVYVYVRYSLRISLIKVRSFKE